ncbi:DUF6817 domain-containing protein [Micromonospora andamanensis]|uniref:DUF6817 domain-containing protein n=1 Tax=Micromonospora andamanensis TaxID=1287068 RepID=A0ABQ4HZE2_9ACTN|nr:hypothetical protein [Micromonospora andamanensis]GIJ11035.1 hypothetical protein Van01_42490 [Micromonospora andamanensis]GIJ39814.1 hypothetical protein Vwe01_31390 [Micromonospora andamanensis]
MGTDEGVRGWLRRLGAEQIAHPGGNLYAHLCRVSDRLAVLGCGGETQAAGLTHAVYGTDGFDLALLDRADRAVLRDLVGADAEELVYLYGACDRGRSWPELAQTGQVFDRFAGRARTPKPAQLRSLMDLSIVNELDVIEHDPTVAARYGSYFRGVFASWAPLASEQVIRDAQRVLGP